MPLTTKQVMLLAKKHHLMPAAYNVAKIAKLCEIGGLKVLTPIQALRRCRNEQELVALLQLFTKTSLYLATGGKIGTIIDSLRK